MAAPAALERGPFSYDKYILDSTTYADNISGRTFSLSTRTQIDPVINEILEVYINGVKLKGSGGTATTGGGDEFFVNSITAPTTLTIVPNGTLASLTPSSGDGSTVTTLVIDDILFIRRVSNRTTKNVDYAPGSVIREIDLDSSNTQIIHVAQEAMDTAILSMILDTDLKWNAQEASTNRVIKGVADGVADNDVVNISQIALLPLMTDGQIANVNIVANNLSVSNDDLGLITETATTQEDGNINLVAGKITEIGRLSTVAAIEDMAILGTAPAVADMDLLGATGVIGDIETVADLNTEVGLLGALDTEIGLIGTPAMTHVSTGYIKLVAGKATEIGQLGPKATAIGQLAVLGTAGVDITTVSNIGTNGADITTVADITSGDITKVANIDDEVSDVADIDTEITTLINGTDGTSGTGGSVKNILLVNSVHGKITEVGNLGTSAVVAHMTALNGTNVITHMTALNGTNVITHMAALNGTNVITHMAALNASNVITHMAALNGTNVITHIANLNASGVITNIAALNATGVIADIADVADVDAEIALLGTPAMAHATNGHLAKLGTTAAVADMAILGDTDITADMALIGATGVIGDIERVSDNVGNLTLVGDDLSGNFSNIEDCGEINVAVSGSSGTSNVALVAGQISPTNNVALVGQSIADVNRYANEYTIKASPAPESPSEGDLWYDSTNNLLKYNNGTSFLSIAALVLSQDTSPQLGGTLDCQNNNITNVGTISGTNISIDFGSIT